MTDTAAALSRDQRIAARLASRHASERRFKALGFFAVALSALVLAFLLITMTSNAVGGFKRAEVQFPLDLSGGVLPVDPAQLGGDDALRVLEGAGLRDVVQFAASKALGDNAATEIDSEAWREVADQIVSNPALLNTSFDVSVAASDDLASGLRGEGEPAIIAMARDLERKDQLGTTLDLGFLTRSDATSPQSVGIWGAHQKRAKSNRVCLFLCPRIHAIGAANTNAFGKAPRKRPHTR